MSRTYTIVKYECGHEVVFSDSPPKVGECNTCVVCGTETVVTAVRRERGSFPTVNSKEGARCGD